MAKRRYRIDKSVLAIGIPKRIRDEKHRRFIASLPCCRTGQQGLTQCCHISHENGKGMSCKVGDDNCVPLSASEHRRQHDTGEVNFWNGDIERAKALAKELYAHSGNVEYGNFLVLMFLQGK